MRLIPLRGQLTKENVHQSTITSGLHFRIQNDAVKLVVLTTRRSQPLFGSEVLTRPLEALGDDVHDPRIDRKDRRRDKALRLLGIPGDTHATVSVFRRKLDLARALTRTFRDPYQ